MTAEKLRERLSQLEGPLFVVLDGAQFENLPGSLLDSDLVHKPLYADRGGQSRDFDLTAPQLVWLSPDTEHRTESDCLDQIISLVGDKPAAVFWDCPAGGEILFRHLRSINMVRIPAETDKDDSPDFGTDDIDFAAAGRAFTAGGFRDPKSWEDFAPNSSDAEEDFAETNQQDGENAEDSGDNSENEPLENSELVLFRHADANVMAQVVPALDKSQFCHLLGPAQTVVFAPSKEWAMTSSGIMVAPRPQDFEKPKGGPLFLDERVMNTLSDARIVASRRNIIAYLEDTAPEYTEKLSEQSLLDLVLLAERTGDEMGLESEYGHGLWAFLTLITGAAITTETGLKNAISSDPAGPDQAVADLLEDMGDADDEQWEAWSA